MPERNLNFDEIINRRGTDCLKYDFAVRRGMPEDVLPLWVADMDFKTTSYVEDAVIERTKHGIFGYSESGEEYFKEVAGWMRRHHNWEIRPEWLIKTPAASKSGNPRLSRIKGRSQSHEAGFQSPCSDHLPLCTVSLRLRYPSQNLYLYISPHPSPEPVLLL